jgi:hypothetical protein
MPEPTISFVVFAKAPLMQAKARLEAPSRETMLEVRWGHDRLLV